MFIFLLLIFSSIFSHDIIWCMDDLSDQLRAAWENKVVVVNGNIDYWSDQVSAFNDMLKDLESMKDNMSHDDYINKKNELLGENRINETNLNSEIRKLEHLKRTDLESVSATESSSSTKRGAESLERDSSKKR